MTVRSADEHEAAARRILAAAPQPPADVGRFTSNVLFGQPGIYPDGPPMAPAEGPPMDGARVASELTRLLDALGVEPTVRPGDARLLDRVHDDALRAACVVLSATVAAPALDELLDRGTVGAIAYGAPAAPGRIVGTPLDAPPDDPVRVVNDRYRAEHFALVTPSLAHALLHHPVGAGQDEEAFLHALLAMVHLQLVAAASDLGQLRTELARRQHSLAITLLNSRQPGDDRIRLVAPDGRGTIPGGDPALQSPDFWSIPFADPRPVGSEAPPALAGVLARLAAPNPVDDAPTRFDDALAHWFDEHHTRRWLSVRAQLRAAASLGLVDPDRETRRWAGLGDPAG